MAANKLAAILLLKKEFFMKKVKDISNQKFGKLTVIKRDLSAPKGRSKWICQCDCGNIVSIYKNHLTSGKTLSCGCAKKRINLKPINPGEKFGKLTIIEMTNQKYRNTYIYKCQCECGNTCFISRNQLISQNVKSCGCLETERSKKAIISIKKERKKTLIEGTDILLISSSKTNKNNTSGRRGVSWDSSVNTWKAYIGFKGKQYYLGSSKDFETACKLRETAENELYGNFLKWYSENYPKEWDKIKNNIKT